MSKKEGKPRLWRLDTDKQVIAANKHWKDFYGVDHLPYDTANLEHTIHPDDLENFFTWVKAYDKQTEFSYTARQKRCDGKYRIRHTMGYPILKNGKFDGMTGTTFDITDSSGEIALEDSNHIVERIGHNVARIRKIRGYSQKEFAEILGIT